MEGIGSVTLIGSGETAATGGQVFEALARQQVDPGAPPSNSKAPLRISVLETPAGFEANAQRVAGRVAEFMQTRLQNFNPQVSLVAARKRGTPFSPDSAEVARPLYDSQMIFFGPGSPTYTVRQLEGSLTWNVIQARQRLGASLVLASAATIAISTLALPVYEIYKVGEDPHWKPGLDFFRPYGLKLAIIPHWNNREGGEEVDTSRCFMGKQRFNALRAMLPEDITLVGIDEHTALTIDFETQTCLVRGVSEVHILRGQSQQTCSAGCTYAITDLGDFHPLSTPESGLPAAVWKQAQEAAQEAAQHAAQTAAGDDRNSKTEKITSIPQEIQKLVEQRQAARQAKDWNRADQLRGQLSNLGWQVKDTPSGPQVQRED